VLYADVRETHEISKALANCGCEQLDLLVNNAGIVRDALIPQTTLDNWNDTLATNFWGAVRAFRQCQPLLKRARCGTTVSLGSISGLRPRKGHAAYSVSKAMLIEWTRQQAARCPYPTLRFFCVSPGPTDTEMIRDAEWYGSNDAQQRIPLGRFADPSEIAGWIAFLAQNPDTIANGTNLVIDGGMLKA
jgi:3-oxoacyl-[acyl-carrier protein] reductase